LLVSVSHYAEMQDTAYVRTQVYAAPVPVGPVMDTLILARTQQLAT